MSGEHTSDGKRRKVGIADAAVVANGSALTTSGVGSCIGVAIYDTNAGIGGLVHVMLPEADGRTENEAKYADTGVNALIRELTDAGADPSTLVAKAAGGSNMLSFESEEPSIGTRNVEAVREALNEVDVPLLAEDVGGNHGRSLRFSPSTGTLEVTSAKQEDVTL